ncbi:MAG: hypothetical protein P8075_17290 [Deltaproteobacteria bacterium]
MSLATAAKVKTVLSVSSWFLGLKGFILCRRVGSAQGNPHYCVMFDAHPWQNDVKSIFRYGWL